MRFLWLRGGKINIAFTKEDANYYYEVMPIGLKNAGVTY